MSEPFSVLMSVYKKENPNYLAQSIDSILNQTLLAHEIIVVEDGPLPQQLKDILDEFFIKNESVKLVKLEKNVGLGRALNEGLKYCKYSLVARMDSDDIAKSNRFEKQINYLETHADVAVVGSNIDEFVGRDSNIVSARIVPENFEEIKKFSRRRNPLNHMTVIFRKEAVEYVGGYLHSKGFEDYYLWMRMINANFKIYNIQESLVNARTEENFYDRRTGWGYFLAECHFQNQLVKLKIIGLSEAIVNIVLRGGVKVIPSKIVKLIYKKKLHVKKPQ